MPGAALLSGLLAGLLIHCAVAAVSQTANTWRIIHKQTASAKGSSSQPSIRYGHTCAAYQGKLVTSHGYFYDRDSHNVNWLSDTWLMGMKAPYKFQMLSPGITQETAISSYQAGQIPPAPCGRFGHADTMLNHTMYMYGGHDGGYSRHGRQNYEPGHDFEELWSFDFGTLRWSFVTPNTTASPGQRYLSAMTGIEDELILYGGMSEGQGDVWAFNTTSLEWQLLAVEEPRGETSPGRRVGHTMTPVHFAHGVARGFILLGGRQIEADGSTVLSQDAWFFDLDSLRWRRLAVDSPAAPAPRTYHAEAHTYIALDRVVKEMNHENAVMVGLVIGGTVTTPQLTCTADAWAFVADCGLTALSWIRLPDMPTAVYDVRAAADPTAVYAFGGHLCAQEPGFPFYYSNQVVRLELGPLVNELVHQGCQIDRKQLKVDAPHAHGGTYDEL